MVIKIMGRTGNVAGLVNYNLKKVQEGHAEILEASRVRVLYDAGVPKADSIIESFKSRIAKVDNPHFKNTMTHISINPDPEDVFTDNELVYRGQELLEKLGFDELPYIMVKHTDIDRQHLHLVICNVDKKGKRVNPSFSRMICNQLRKEWEMKYNLHRAADAKQRQRPEAKKEQSKSHKIKRSLEGLLRKWSFFSMDSWRTICSIKNINVLVGAGDGVSYAMMDEDKKNTSPWIAASNLDESLGKAGLEEKFAKCKEKDKLHNEAYQRYRNHMKDVLGSWQQIDDEDTLNRVAAERQVGLVFSVNKNGQAFGLTVIDFKNGRVMKATDIDRNLKGSMWAVVAGKKFPPNQTLKFGFINLNKEQRKAIAQTITTTQVKRPVIPTAANPAALMKASHGKKRHQDEANTHWHPSDDEEEQTRKKGHNFYD